MDNVIGLEIIEVVEQAAIASARLIDRPNASLLLGRTQAGASASGNSPTQEVPGERWAVSGNLSSRVPLKVL